MYTRPLTFKCTCERAVWSRGANLEEAEGAALGGSARDFRIANCRKHLCHRRRGCWAMQRHHRTALRRYIRHTHQERTLECVCSTAPPQPMPRAQTPYANSRAAARRARACPPATPRYAARPPPRRPPRRASGSPGGPRRRWCRGSAPGTRRRPPAGTSSHGSRTRGRAPRAAGSCEEWGKGGHGSHVWFGGRALRQGTRDEQPSRLDDALALERGHAAREEVAALHLRPRQRRVLQGIARYVGWGRVSSRATETIASVLHRSCRVGGIAPLHCWKAGHCQCRTRPAAAGNVASPRCRTSAE